MLWLVENEFSQESKLLSMLELRETLHLCASPERFSENIRVMKRVRNTKVDKTLTRLSHLHDALGNFPNGFAELIVNEYLVKKI